MYLSKPRRKAIFLTNRFFHLYDFDKLRKEHNVQLIGILTAQMAEYSRFFLDKLDNVYIIDEDKQGLSWVLNYGQVKNIVIKELQNTNAENVSIICNDDVTMPLCGQIREEIGLKGVGAEDLLLFSNKLKSKLRIVKKDICIPKYSEFNYQEWHESCQKYFNKLVQQIGLPFVFKPINCASSLGVVFVNKFDDFKDLTPIATQEYECEEFIDGEMYHCDSITHEGKVLFSAVSKYNYPMGDFLKGMPIGSIILPDRLEITKQIKKFNKKVLKALDMKSGITHFELFSVGSKLIFLEIAIRSPGGLAIPAYVKAYDVNLLEEDFKIQISTKYKLRKISRRSNAFWMLFPNYKGQVLKTQEPNIKSKYLMYWYVAVGDVKDKSKSLSETSAAMLAWGRPYIKLYNDFISLAETKVVATV